jgi:anti-sigma factor RsiW
MSRCWLEGELRAYLDRELPPLEIEAVERHLTECTACAAVSTELAGRAARVGELLRALEQVSTAPLPVRRAAPAWRRVGLAAGLALAAACLILDVLLPKRREPVSAPQPITPALLAPAKVQPSPKPANRAVRGTASRNQTEYYLALDDEPIDSGVVLRVTLPDSGLLADVIYDEQGRPRAVRPLN